MFSIVQLGPSPFCKVKCRLVRLYYSTAENMDVPLSYLVGFLLWWFNWKRGAVCICTFILYIFWKITIAEAAACGVSFDSEFFPRLTLKEGRGIHMAISIIIISAKIGFTEKATIVSLPQLLGSSFSWAWHSSAPACVKIVLQFQILQASLA